MHLWKFLEYKMVYFFLPRKKETQVLPFASSVVGQRWTQLTTSFFTKCCTLPFRAYTRRDKHSWFSSSFTSPPSLLALPPQIQKRWQPGPGSESFTSLRACLGLLSSNCLHIRQHLLNQGLQPWPPRGHTHTSRCLPDPSDGTSSSYLKLTRPKQSPEFSPKPLHLSKQHYNSTSCAKKMPALILDPSFPPPPLTQWVFPLKQLSVSSHLAIWSPPHLHHRQLCSGWLSPQPNCVLFYSGFQTSHLPHRCKGAPQAYRLPALTAPPCLQFSAGTLAACRTILRVAEEGLCNGHH